MAAVQASAESTSTGGMPSDAAMGRAIVQGVSIGVPVLVAIIFVIELLAGMEPGLAALGALLPGAIFGAFIGSAFAIGRASDAAHRGHG